MPNRSLDSYANETDALRELLLKLFTLASTDMEGFDETKIFKDVRKVLLESDQDRYDRY